MSDTIVIHDVVTEVVQIASPGLQGVGVPAGGASGQVLAKASNTDYDTHWAAGGNGGSLPAWWTVSATPTGESAYLMEIPATFWTQGLPDGERGISLVSSDAISPLPGSVGMDIRVKVGYAALRVMNSGGGAALEAGSTPDGNNPTRISDDGSIYMSTIDPNRVALEIDSADSWGLGPQFANMLVVHGTDGGGSNDPTIFSVGPSGQIFTALPTVDPAAAGFLWNDAGTVKVSAG